MARKSGGRATTPAWSEQEDGGRGDVTPLVMQHINRLDKSLRWSLVEPGDGAWWWSLVVEPGDGAWRWSLEVEPEVELRHINVLKRTAPDWDFAATSSFLARLLCHQTFFSRTRDRTPAATL